MRRLWLMPLFFMLTVCVYFYQIGGFGFIDPYETLYYAKNFDLNNFINYIAFYIFGYNEFAGRILQVMLGLSCALLTFAAAKILTINNRKAAQIALFITLTSPLYFIVSRLNTPDIFFAFAFTLSMLGYIYKIQNPDNNKFKANLLFYSGMALASLSGGLMRGTLAVLSIVSLHILIINWRHRKIYFKEALPNFHDLFSPLGLIIYAVLISPLFLNKYALNHNLFLSFNKIYLLAFCPWLIFILIYIKKLFKLLFNNEENFTLNQDDALLLCLWAALAFIFNFPNITPCIMPLAILAAVLILENIFESLEHRLVKKFTFYILCLCVVASLIFAVKALNYIALNKSHKEISQIALNYLSYENNPDINFLYYGDMRGLNFYLNREILNINNADIGDWDVKTSNNKNLRRLWNGSKRILLIIKRDDLDEFIKIIGREPVKVGESAGDILLTNY